MSRLSSLRIEEPGFEVVSSGRSYRCRFEGCENRVLGFGDACAECLDEDAGLTVVRSSAAPAFESWEKWDRRIKTALEAWLALCGFLKTSELVNWLLVIFYAWFVSYLTVTYGDAIWQWLSDLAGAW